MFMVYIYIFVHNYIGWQVEKCRANVPVWVWKMKAAVEPGRTNISVQKPAGEFSPTWGNVSLMFYSGLQLTEWNPATLWKKMCFSPLIKKLISSKHFYRNTQNDVWLNVWLLCNQSSWHIQLITTIWICLFFPPRSCQIVRSKEGQMQMITSICNLASLWNNYIVPPFRKLQEYDFS